MPQLMNVTNKLIHEYFGVDLEIVWAVIKEELPPLLPHLKELLPEKFQALPIGV